MINLHAHLINIGSLPGKKGLPGFNHPFFYPILALEKEESKQRQKV